MLKNYFKTSFRSLWKNKNFTAINIIGLTLGLSSIMALGLMLYQFLTYDSQFADKGRMAYFKTKAKEGTEFRQTPYPLLYAALSTCPDIEAGTHIQTWNNPWLKYKDKEVQENYCAYVDTGFFRVFSFPLKYGSADNALNEKSSIVLSEETAIKLFGNENPVGKVIAADDTVLLTVKAVMKHIPNNTSIKPKILLTTALLNDNPGFVQGANWYNTFAENYIKLKKDAHPEKLEQQLDQIVQTHYSEERKSERIKIVSFRKLVPETMGVIGNAIVSGSIAVIAFILLIVIVNMVNLNAGIMYARVKEVAVRQMMGSGKRSIFLQFFVENCIVIFGSLIFAFIFFKGVLVAQMNQMFSSQFGEIELDLSRSYPLVLLFILLGFLIAFAISAYPVWHLTSLKVTDAIKGKLSRGNRKSYTRTIFITTQFVLSITLIYITIILNKQLGHMKSVSLGFNPNDVVVVNLDLAFKNKKSSEARFDAILNNLRSNTMVKSFSTNSIIPTAYWNNFNQYADVLTNKEISLRQAGADAGYFSTYEIPLLEGRYFRNLPGNSEEGDVIINKAAMKAFGWKTAIGKQIKAKGSNTVYTVIGVTDDFKYRSLANDVEPLVHFYSGMQSLNNNYLSICTQKGKTMTVLAQLENDFKSMPSKRAFSYEMMTDKVDNQYGMLNNILKMTRYVAFLTIFIACMGMLGLISLFAKLRVKEIGVRKVFGAGVMDIVKLLSKNFVLMAIMASVIAAPMAWLLMSSWLQNFAYRIQIEWWMLMVGALAAILIVLVTLIFQAIKAAVANPVKSLRTE
ncbi:MAG: ABC transporter permease [Bacteroidetes bacterium]|nr:ABC transporter permease [Bacteroidota bacterium]